MTCRLVGDGAIRTLAVVVVLLSALDDFEVEIAK
jgi:hypothetical protein